MPRILIVDDEKSIRYTLREILEYEKYAIDEAEDGERALEALKHTRYDVVVGSSRVDLQACKLEYSIVSPK